MDQAGVTYSLLNLGEIREVNTIQLQWEWGWDIFSKNTELRL